MYLSIIIPVFNVEKFIEQCLISCFNQQNAILGSDYEIIIVNDGSKDDSHLKIVNLIRDKEGIKYIVQENKGLSVARNNGFKIANGDYIWFVDSDDWVSEFAVSLITDQIKRSYNDIIKIRAVLAYPNNEYRELQSAFKTNRITSGKEEGPMSFRFTAVQFCIYNRKWLRDNNLSFMPSVYHEDNEFTPRMYWYANKVGFINPVLYYYRQNPDSISKKPNPKKSFDLIKVCLSLSKFSNDVIGDEDQEYKRSLNNFICLSLNNAFNNIKSQSASVIFKFESELKENSNLLVHLKESSKLKYKIEWLLLKLTNRYVKTYKLLSHLT